MLFPIKQYAQNLKYVHSSEIWWVLTHPLIAKDAYEITKKASKIAADHINDPDLDGDYNGGQVDAFRHTLWMAMLVQKIKPKAAYKLGIAHENGNYKDYKKHKLEENSLPDYVAGQMDLNNNNVGIDIGQIYKGTLQDTLELVVKRAIKDGKCWIIKKNKSGDFLDENNMVIPENQWKGKWKTPKILVRSDYRRPLH